jgi:hypothetical protein
MLLRKILTLLPDDATVMMTRSFAKNSLAFYKLAAEASFGFASMATRRFGGISGISSMSPETYQVLITEAKLEKLLNPKQVYKEKPKEKKEPFKERGENQT